MNVTLSNLDWSLVQAFLAVAETGSLSGAARALGTSQPTIGRHIQAVEDNLGAALFHRQARGMALTDFGETLLEPARAMQLAAAQLAQTAAGGSSDLTGTVRITASLFVSHHVLPPVLAEMRETYPDIQLDLVASDQSENLLFREADIAVRMYRPRQLDMVTRHIGSVQGPARTGEGQRQQDCGASRLEEVERQDQRCVCYCAGFGGKASGRGCLLVDGSVNRLLSFQTLDECKANYCGTHGARQRRHGCAIKHQTHRYGGESAYHGRRR